MKGTIVNEKVSQYDEGSYSDDVVEEEKGVVLAPRDSHFQKYKQVYYVLGTVGGIALAAGVGAGIVIGSKATKSAIEKSNVVLDVTDGILYASQAQAANRLGANPSQVSSLMHKAANQTVQGHKLAKVNAVATKK